MSPRPEIVAVPIVFTLDRVLSASRADLAESIASYLGDGKIVQVQDSSKPLDERLRYTIMWFGEAGRVFDGSSRPLGVFAHLDALVHHAETATA